MRLGQLTHAIEITMAKSMSTVVIAPYANRSTPWSTEFVSFEKRFVIRPCGVVSKKDIFVRRTLKSIISCSFLDTDSENEARKIVPT